MGGHSEPGEPMMYSTPCLIHAERNQDIRIKQDRFETVGEEYHLMVGKDRFAEIKGDRHHHVKVTRTARSMGPSRLRQAWTGKRRWG